MMKKKMKIYEQPTVKVVRFMVEQGFAASPGGGEGGGQGGGTIIGGGDDEEEESPFHRETYLNIENHF